MRNACTFYIVRHGQTDWNVNRHIQGHTDVALNGLGRSQAQELSKKLQSITFDSVFSSDLLRAKETAEIIVFEKKIAIQTTKLLRERFFGRLEGKQNDELIHMLEEVRKLPFSARASFKPYEDYETDEELVSRFITFLREVAVGYPNKTVLVVSHGGMMRALLFHLGFAKHEELAIGAIKNAAYMKLQSDGVEFSIRETEGIIKKTL